VRVRFKFKGVYHGVILTKMDFILIPVFVPLGLLFCLFVPYIALEMKSQFPYMSYWGHVKEGFCNALRNRYG
jgi:hypothetical protein